jgi:hypothetical protein
VEKDTTWLERGCGSDLDLKVLDGLLSKLRINPSYGDFINSSVPCIPICLN